MIGKVYIIGQIGNTLKEDGSIDVKGVELVDVVSQVNALGLTETDTAEIYIKSHGGGVDVGNAIALFIEKLANAITIADEYCESIATRIHLARPLAQRKIIAGTKYTVHNPLLTNVSGNADELTEMATYIKQYEKKMLTMYCQAVTIDKDTMAGLMQQETSLTDEQTKALGFASEIIPKDTLKAVAFYDNKKKPKEEITMAAVQKTIKESIAAAFAGIVGKKPLKAKAAAAPIAKGETLTTADDTPIYTDVAIADFIADQAKVVKVFSDEAMTTPVADGDYTLKDGTVIGVKGGVLDEVAPGGEVEVEDSVEALQARIVELETANANMRAEFDTELAAAVTELKTSLGSNYTPKAEVRVFSRKQVQAAAAAPQKKTMKELAQERAASYKKPGAATTKVEPTEE